MTYAVSAWWGYTTAADKQRLEALLRRAVRVGLYPTDGPSLQQLVADVDDALFAICTNSGESTSCTARTVTSPYLPQIWTTQQKAQLHS